MAKAPSTSSPHLPAVTGGDAVPKFVAAVELLLRAIELEDRRLLKPGTVGAAHRIYGQLASVQSPESEAIKERLLAGVYD